MTVSKFFLALVCQTAIVAFVALPVHADLISISDLYNTGVDNSGNAIANGATDTHWSVVGSPTISGTANYYNGSPKAYYIDQYNGGKFGPTGTSSWISPPNATAATSPYTPVSPAQDVVVAVYQFVPTDYTYQTTFTLPAGFLSASISGKWVCDNDSQGIFLNGNLLTDLVNNPTGGYQEFTTSNQSFFTSGTNTLQFIVRNIRQNAENYNPSGMQVQVNGVYAVPEPSSVVLALVGAGLAGAVCHRRRKAARG
jgi:hypothetical protein